MAITDNGTAQDINTLLNWLFPSAGRSCAVPRSAAMKVAERLAEKAYRQLQAGISGPRIRQAVAFDSWRFDAIDNGGNDD